MACVQSARVAFVLYSTDTHRMRAARYPCMQCTKPRAVSDRKGVCVYVWRVKIYVVLDHPGVLARC